MNNDKSTITKKTELQNSLSPVFVQAEMMFEKLDQITNEMANRAFDVFVEGGSQFGTQLSDWLRAESELLRAAPVKITETADDISVFIAVPGFNTDQIEVSVKDEILMVSGDTSSEENTNGEIVVVNEWRSSRFLRKLALPSKVISDEVQTKLVDGILTLILKKKAEIGDVLVSAQTA